MSSTTKLLFDAARRGELHHAVILQGSSRTLLADIATTVAKVLNCENGSTGDSCTSCSKIDRGVHPDVHGVVLAEERKMIAIEQVRSLVGEATLRPYEGRFKVFIIDPADAMSPAAANALLKTLEEPTRNTIFLLLTRAADLLLPTIRSRAQLVTVRGDATTRTSRLPDELRRLVVATEDYGRTPDVIRQQAIEVLGSLRRFAEHRDYAALLSIAAAIGDSDDTKEGSALLATILRDIAAGASGHTLDPEAAEVVRQKIPPRKLLEAAKSTVEAVGRCAASNADARMMLEGALLILAKN